MNLAHSLILISLGKTGLILDNDVAYGQQMTWKTYSAFWYSHCIFSTFLKYTRTFPIQPKWLHLIFVRMFVGVLPVPRWNALGQVLQFRGLVREGGDVPSEIQTRKPSNTPQNNKCWLSCLSESESRNALAVSWGSKTLASHSLGLLAQNLS